MTRHGRQNSGEKIKKILRKFDIKNTSGLCVTKGQLISKCPFGFIVWTKISTKLFPDFCPEFFCSFLGASWKLFGLPGDLVCNIINKEAYRKPQKASMKPPGSYKKFQGRNPEIILLLFWEKLIFHKDIIKLSDLYDLSG